MIYNERDCDEGLRSATDCAIRYTKKNEIKLAVVLCQVDLVPCCIYIPSVCQHARTRAFVCCTPPPPRTHPKYFLRHLFFDNLSVYIFLFFFFSPHIQCGLYESSIFIKSSKLIIPSRSVSARSMSSSISSSVGLSGNL